MTDEQVVDLYLRVSAHLAEQMPENANWLQMFSREPIPAEQYRRALDILREKWERSLAFDDLLLRVARLETERMPRG